jgi:ATP-dependent RNA helicase DDX6/DHH1
VIRDISKFIPALQCIVSTGGTSFQEDIFRLQNTVHVLVGTPGRIFDLCHKNIVKFLQADTLVLDEVDKILSVDFQPIIEGILKFFPSERYFLNSNGN